jgi:hypothetical protein
MAGVKLKRTWQTKRDKNMKETIFPVKQLGRGPEFINEQSWDNILSYFFSARCLIPYKTSTLKQERHRYTSHDH